MHIPPDSGSYVDEYGDDLLDPSKAPIDDRQSKIGNLKFDGNDKEDASDLFDDNKIWAIPFKMGDFLQLKVISGKHS